MTQIKMKPLLMLFLEEKLMQNHQIFQFLFHNAGTAELDDAKFPTTVGLFWDLPTSAALLFIFWNMQSICFGICIVF